MFLLAQMLTALFAPPPQKKTLNTPFPEVQATVVPAADDMNGHTGPGRVGHTGPGRVGHTGPDQVGHTGSGVRLHRR